ncbi:MAG: hypothetical protein Q7J01_00640 [Syntrophales bacterium]|nr:hypothetical protein [Syntrophales bacterium]
MDNLTSLILLGAGATFVCLFMMTKKTGAIRKFLGFMIIDQRQLGFPVNDN